jgi:hypothetical protein
MSPTMSRVRDLFDLLAETASVLRSSSGEADDALASASAPADPKLGIVCLAGHSGGYTSVAACLGRGGVPVREVYLFDALYGEVAAFREWVLAGKDPPRERTRDQNGRSRHKLVSYYVGERVRSNNLELSASLEAAGVACLHELTPGELSRAQMVEAIGRLGGRECRRCRPDPVCLVHGNQNGALDVGPIIWADASCWNRQCQEERDARHEIKLELLGQATPSILCGVQRSNWALTLRSPSQFSRPVSGVTWMVAESSPSTRVMVQVESSSSRRTRQVAQPAEVSKLQYGSVHCPLEDATAPSWAWATEIRIVP